MVRDQTLIEQDIKKARADSLELLEFMKDKPFMKDKLNSILKALSDKIKFLEHIVESQQVEIKLLTECTDSMTAIMEVKANIVSKGEIIANGLNALYELKDGH